jgi:hypothetical protein
VCVNTKYLSVTWSRTQGDEDERVSGLGFIGADDKGVRGAHTKDGGGGQDCAGSGWLAG